MKKLGYIPATLLAVLVTALSVICLTLPASADVSDAVIMDFSSAEAFAKNGIFYAHKDNGYDADTKTFNIFGFTEVDGEGCLELYYNYYGNHWSPFRFMPRFAKKNAITEDHHYMRITYMTDDIEPSIIRIRNNGTGTKYTLVPNSRVSGGEFVRSNCIDIYEQDGEKSDGSINPSMVHRFIDGSHCSFEYMNTSENGSIYIKEIGFFTSEEDAYAYYNDEKKPVDIEYSAMTFEAGGTGSVLTSNTANYGNTYRDLDGGVVDVYYADTTNFKDIHYMMKLYFTNKSYLGNDHKFVRILYSADMPESAEPTVMELDADAGGGKSVFENIVDTNGEFVLSTPCEMAQNMYDRFVSGGHNSLVFLTDSKDCVFTVKALFFFRNEEEALSFNYTEGKHSIKINGNDIENYKIVIADDAPPQVTEAAKLFCERVKYLTGTELKIVTDAVPVGRYEILYGRSNREKSYLHVLGDNDIYQNEEYKRAAMSVSGDTLIVTAHLPYNLKSITEMIKKYYLYDGLTIIPETIELKDGTSYFESIDSLTLYEKWTKPENVSAPEVFKDDFSADDGYFVEENNASDFSIAGGVMSSDTDDFALTYLHLYETNAVFSADFKASDMGDNGDFGIMLRYNEELAWVKAGYSKKDGKWYITSKDGRDFYTFVLAEKAASIEENKVYRVGLTVDGMEAVLTVDGEEFLRTDKLTHFSPGRAAIYAEDMKLTLDNAELTMLSGQGELMKNVTHNKLPTGKYTEGGTVIERADGKTATYVHHHGYVFNSTDGGKSWVRDTDESYIPVAGYYNVIRLNNGDLLQIATKNGYVISRTSSDDGVTWTDGGNICHSVFNGDKTLNAVAGNMNDKLFQCAEDSKWKGRILYSSNYEASNTGTGFEGRYVFCEYYYSDDNGATWHHSETDSWEIEGNEDAIHFGECKFLELDDGTIRMYNSWNYYDCIVYSDSYDGGVTFGPLQFLYDFPCSTSSMQFVRDKYADNNHTYYMVWVDGFDHDPVAGTRCGLSLAYSEDGRTWVDLGVIWRWESTYFRGAAINHVVDPFIQVTKDNIICGSGFSDGLYKDDEGGESYHQGQRQHIYSIPKITFVPEENFAKLYTQADFLTLARDTQLVMIEASTNDKTYSFGETEFFYSPKYMAHVTILPASLTKTDIYLGTTHTNTPAAELSYNCNINGDNSVTAGDAAICSQMLHDPESDNYTAKMRLEADCFGDYAADADGKITFVSVLDAFAALLSAVGLY